MIAAEESLKQRHQPNKDIEATEKSLLLLLEAEHVRSSSLGPDNNNNNHQISRTDSKHGGVLWKQLLGVLHQLWEELTTPPVIAAIFGLIFGAVTWFHNLLIGENAPFKVIDDSIKLLGDGTIPCITLILGGNLTQGLKNSRMKPTVIIAVLCVKYIILPPIGIVAVKAASHLGFLPSDPLYHFVLMIQFTLPPAMNIGTMTQLFDVAQEECSVLFLWTYLVAAFALTGWSTVFMWLLS